MIDRILDRPLAGYAPSSRPIPSQTPLMKASDISQFIQPVETLILQYPAVALASAFLVGVALACWIKRR